VEEALPRQRLTPKDVVVLCGGEEKSSEDEKKAGLRGVQWYLTDFIVFFWSKFLMPTFFTPTLLVVSSSSKRQSDQTTD
jgi:hypothetical protein